MRFRMICSRLSALSSRLLRLDRLSPEQPKCERRDERQKSREREPEIEGAHAVGEPAEEFLDLRWHQPCRDAGEAGNFSLMLGGDVLRESVIERKNPERARAGQRQHREQQPALA